jgi:hypothetical protein
MPDQLSDYECRAGNAVASGSRRCVDQNMDKRLDRLHRKAGLEWICFLFSSLRLLSLPLISWEVLDAWRVACRAWPMM